MNTLPMFLYIFSNLEITNYQLHLTEELYKYKVENKQSIRTSPINCVIIHMNLFLMDIT